MQDQPTLATERLLLRPFQGTDAARVQSLAGNPAVARMTSNIPHPYTDGEAENWIAAHADDWQRRSAAIFAVCLRCDAELIGAVGLMNIHHGDTELGYWIGEPHWGQGYASEAVDAVIGFGMTSLELARVHAHHLSRNPASGKVLRNAGLTRTGKGTVNARDGVSQEDAEFYELILIE
ncbi:GNAT family N-acetyltransferase [Pseudohongiella sp.]|uniref:N-acetyltransferase domain-containing protein n=1 Tax=marine sediment metagenome TaxID=412755 RepID=A0A0F9YHS3_9ZZZZ|nr:GNAT family N-acetyltransferase [Pseudohongiella sp.]HDZ08985.1 N-acetyltransferase [Pseudohongiella sp.]HEA62670.1 N-acetyltransferase [Pseudohongiella sp.]